MFPSKKNHSDWDDLTTAMSSFALGMSYGHDQGQRTIGAGMAPLLKASAIFHAAALLGGNLQVGGRQTSSCAEVSMFCLDLGAIYSDIFQLVSTGPQFMLCFFVLVQVKKCPKWTDSQLDPDITPYRSWMAGVGLDLVTWSRGICSTNNMCLDTLL